MKPFALALIISTAVVVSHAESTATTTAADAAWKNEMERKIDLLTQELEKKNLPDVQTTAQTYESKHGFAPAASKVYHIQKGVSFGGYGEMYLQDPNRKQDNGSDTASSSNKRTLDFLRLITYIGYKFNDAILFNSEIEYEHASTTSQGARGEVSVEFAYLDFHLSDPLGLRAGMVLVPVGFINELHEPTTFLGARRPSVETNIIPTTWRENGIGIYGEFGNLSYRSYLLAGLQATDSPTGVSGFSASSALRNGRSKGAVSRAEDFAWVGRVDYDVLPSLRVGGALYTGQAGQNDIQPGTTEVEAPVTLWEIHSAYHFKGLELRGLYAKGTVGDVTNINVANGLTGTSSVGERFFGGYVEVAYDVLSLLGKKQYLAPYFRYERYDTQQKVPSGYSKNPANSRTEYVVGVAYKPIPQIVIKADYQDVDNQAGTGVNQLNMTLGYVF